MLPHLFFSALLCAPYIYFGSFILLAYWWFSLVQLVFQLLLSLGIQMYAGLLIDILLPFYHFYFYLYCLTVKRLLLS